MATCGMRKGIPNEARNYLLDRRYAVNRFRGRQQCAALSGWNPDLSGIWTNVTITPLERPRDLAAKAFFTPEEAAQYEKTHIRNRDNRTEIKGTVNDVLLAYNDVWWDSGTHVVKTLRTSMIVDPPDGRIPALTEERQRELRATAEARRVRCQHPGCEPENSGQLGPADGPEDRPLMERCLWFGTAAPLMPSAYNNNYEIAQTDGFVAIDVEMVHQMRWIPIDGSPHLPAHVRQWAGDSRGHWEGDTLVVDTTNFNDKVSFRGSGSQFAFNRAIHSRRCRYDHVPLTIDDPTAFTKSWTGEIPFVKSPALFMSMLATKGMREWLESFRPRAPMRRRLLSKSRIQFGLLSHHLSLTAEPSHRH